MQPVSRTSFACTRVARFKTRRSSRCGAPPSGSGKSSAVLAGLVPSLTAGLLPGSERWQHVVMRPGEHPIHELRSATGSAGFGTNGDGDLAASTGQVEAGGRLVLLVDQFEELFTTTVDA